VAYFDKTAWDAATLLAPDITIAYDDDNRLPVIEIIEEICRSLFGIFDITPDGLFTFRFIGFDIVYAQSPGNWGSLDGWAKIDGVGSDPIISGGNLRQYTRTTIARTITGIGNATIDVVAQVGFFLGFGTKTFRIGYLDGVGAPGNLYNQVVTSYDLVSTSVNVPTTATALTFMLDTGSLVTGSIDIGKIVAVSSISTAEIHKTDYFNPIEVTYDPSEVISSVRIGYAYDWATDEYTYLTDDSVEAATFDKYKTYKEQTFDTLLLNAADAQALATKILNYTKDVHGITTRQLPISFHGIEVGDIISVELNRSVNTMIGTKTCEVTGISYNLALPSINATVRIV
jgi:hypothetical protein